MQPIAFHIGSLAVHWYGVLMALAFIVGVWTAGRRAPLSGIASEKITDIGIWLLVGAIIGARTLFVISYWREEFAGKPFWEIFNMRAGFVYYGGLIGGTLAVILYARVRRLPLWKVADILSPSIALGYVFGRIGCLMNGCCYGRACDLPWAIRFPSGHGTHRGGLEAIPVHPTQIYDSLLNLGFYLALALLYRRKRFDGQVFATYLMGYALLRSFVELFRGDYTAEHLYGGLTPAQLVSIGIFAAGAFLFWMLRPRAAKGS